MITVTGQDGPLATIKEEQTPKGTKFIVPECRMMDAAQTQDFSRRLIQNDEKRAFKRSRVDGLVGGEPPYRASSLKASGHADRCNVNWGTSRSLCETGSGAFYDLTSEAPSFFTFRTRAGTPEQKEMWSNRVSKIADEIISEAKTFDYNIQLSQWDMILHGLGPFMFENETDVLPRAVRCGDVYVPEFTKSDTEYWEACALQVQYYPPELYAFIKNPEAAKAAGWNVEFTKKVIANAMQIDQQRGVYQDWEFYEQKLKNNSFNYMDDDSKVCRIMHVFWKEFDGRITHGIVEVQTATGLVSEYLFIKVGRYASFQECVHPMYYDHGNGGYHHSVTGLGVKMYSAMAYENRLRCNLCDKAFAPKILFKPTSAEASQKFSLAHFGDYAVMPAGFEWQQTGVAGLMNDGAAMLEIIKDSMQKTLSNYSTGIPEQKSGNPVTKFEKQMQAAAQSALNKTQFNRYYKQWDFLAAEMFRRMTKSSSNEMAKQFRKRCEELEVPKECYSPENIEYIGLTRVVGQGSAFMRKQAIDSLFTLAGTLPEEGRENLIRDKIAAEAGQTAVLRYFPQREQNLPTDQQAEAMQWVGVMKTGVPCIVTSSQNPVTYAATFIKACSDSLQSLQQGGDEKGIYDFLHTAGPCILAQLQRFASDGTRKPVFDEMLKQWKQIAAVTDKLKASIENKMKQQAQQQQKTQQTMSDEQLKETKVKHDIALKTAKTRAQLEQSRQKHQMHMAQAGQALALEDAKTANGIRNSRLKAFSE